MKMKERWKKNQQEISTQLHLRRLKLQLQELFNDEMNATVGVRNAWPLD
jgi:hypothetical protein